VARQCPPRFRPPRGYREKRSPCEDLANHSNPNLIFAGPEFASCSPTGATRRSCLTSGHPHRVQMHPCQQATFSGAWPAGFSAKMVASRIGFAQSSRRIATRWERVTLREYKVHDLVYGRQSRGILLAGSSGEAKFRKRCGLDETFVDVGALGKTIEAQSPIPKPQRVLRANTSCDSTGIASSQQTNSIRKRSSPPPRQKISEPSPECRCLLYVCSRMRRRARSPAQLSHKVCVPPERASRGLSGKPANRPGLKCGHQGGLNGVPNIPMYCIPLARQHGQRAAVFVPEAVLNQFGRGQGVWISLIQRLRRASAPGHSRAPLASSKLSARRSEATDTLSLPRKARLLTFLR